MINRLIRFIQNNASLRKVIIGILIIVLFNTVLLPLFPSLFGVARFPISDILDLKFCYTADTVYTIFSNIGVDGRRVYLLSEIFVDFPYAVFYGFVYASIIALLINRVDNSKSTYLIFIPFGISLFDIFENIGLVTLLIKYPSRLEYLVIITSAMTSIKWIFAVLTTVVILSLIIKSSILNRSMN